MRGAARKPAEEPPPAKADLDARLAGVLDGQMELVTRATALLDRCPDPRLLRQLITEVIGWGLHAEEMRAEMARYTAVNAGGDSFFELGRAYERSLIQDAAKATVPGPRHARGAARYRPGEGQRALFSVKTIPGIAVAALVGLKVLGKHAGRVLAHPHAVRLTAHTARVAAGAAAGAGAAATAVVIVLAPGAVHAGTGGPSSGTSVGGWHTSASPIPSSSLIARTVTHPKPKHGRKQLLSASGLPLLCCSPEPSASASSAPASASPSVSVQVGPATLEVGATSLDLSLNPQAILSLSATGTGWVSWKISTGGTDLAFSQDHGVLQAGQSVEVTVSLAPALDALTAQVFEVNGQSVTVSLPLPVPVPSAVASVLPSVLPSL